MKKMICMFLAVIFAAMIFAFPAFAAAEALTGTAITAAVPTELFTWEYLATIAGATAATLLIAQCLKIPLDMVWKIPTRFFVYVIALVILTVATAYTTGLTPDTFLLCVMNAFIVALSAYGAYELTFAGKDKKL